jgi:hypothetical protein
MARRESRACSFFKRRMLCRQAAVVRSKPVLKPSDLIAE